LSLYQAFFIKRVSLNHTFFEIRRKRRQSEFFCALVEIKKHYFHFTCIKLLFEPTGELLKHHLDLRLLDVFQKIVGQIIDRDKFAFRHFLQAFAVTKRNFLIGTAGTAENWRKLSKQLRINGIVRKSFSC